MVEKRLLKLELDSKANVYFDGRVTSRSCYREDGTRFTLGIITPGCYTFGTGDKEILQMIAGDVEVLRPGDTDWVAFSAGDTLEVAPNCEFQIRTYGVAEYLCDYIKD